jgi:hypothetical protein
MKRGMLALALITPHEYSPLFLAQEQSRSLSDVKLETGNR